MNRHQGTLYTNVQACSLFLVCCTEADHSVRLLQVYGTTPTVAERQDTSVRSTPGTSTPTLHPHSPGRETCFLFKGKKDDIKANWTYARSWCREQGGDLAVIDNQDWFLHFKPVIHRFCVKLPEGPDNQYAWSDGVSPVLYTNWNDKEPNNAEGTNCVEMYPDGLWNDNNCLQKRGFVCRHHQCKDQFAYFSGTHGALFKV
uniref:C-type lectin domain-containing protein n=1 Tax=Takifugu rubripes TaxID=31033 RepID=A0A3B5K7G8_TAKRU